MIRKSNPDTDRCPPVGASFHDSYDDSDFVEQIAEELAELKDDVAELVSAKLDAVKTAVRKQFLGVAIRVVLMAAVAAFISISAYFTLAGISGAVGALASNTWLGSMVAGLMGLTAAFAGLRALVRRSARGVGPAKPRREVDDPF